MIIIQFKRTTDFVIKRFDCVSYAIDLSNV